MKNFYYPGQALDIKIGPDFTSPENQESEITKSRERSKELLPKIQELLKDKAMSEILHTVFCIGSAWGCAGGITMVESEQQIAKQVGESWLK